MDTAPSPAPTRRPPTDADDDEDARGASAATGSAAGGECDTLLVRGCRGVLYAWTHFFSPTALPLFRVKRHGEKTNRILLRDLLVLAFLCLSVVTFAAWPALRSPLWRAAVGGLVVYRATDVALTLLALGIFGSLRHEATLHELPRHRIQRLMVAILINYLELLFWFATLYLWVGQNDPTQFDGPIRSRGHAFFVSMSTQTTTGYGLRSPVGTTAMALATVQAILGLIVLVMVIGGLVGSLKEDREELTEPPLTGPRRYLVHGLSPFIAYLAAVAVAYWVIEV